MTVDSRPSDEQPLLLRHLALEPRDRIGQRVERRRQQPRVLVVPAVAVAKGDLARQVAGRGDLAHHVGDRRERPGDGARDREAEERREHHRQHRGDGEPGVDRLAATAAARSASAGSARPAPTRAGRAAGRGERPRQRFVVLAADRQVGRCRSSGGDGRAPGRSRAAGSTARTWPSMPKATSLPVICFNCAASASSSRKPMLNVPRISRRGTLDGDRDGDDLQDAVRLRQQARGCRVRASASRTAGWLAAIAAARGEPPDGDSTWPDLVGDQQQAGVAAAIW